MLAIGSGRCPHETKLEYDRNGWVVSVGGEPVEHDDAGHVTKVGTGDEAMTFEYVGDRLVKTNGPSYQNDSFQYDESGRLVCMGMGGLETGSSTVFRYDCAAK